MHNDSTDDARRHGHALAVGELDVGQGVTLRTAGFRKEPTAAGNVTWINWRIWRGQTDDIGGIDYNACHTCQTVLLNEIGIIASEQNHGLGRRVIEALRADLPGYRWHTTPAKTRSRPFWNRLQHAHPGEYHTSGTGPCGHLEALA